MKSKEAIETIKVAIAEVEWDYPMDYTVAFETAIEALEESKIITCKDCKYHCANYCTRDIKGRTNMFYMEDDAFCSEAIKAGEQDD